MLVWEALAFKHLLKSCPYMEGSRLWASSGDLMLGELLNQGKAAREMTEAPRERGKPKNSCNAKQGKGWRGDGSRESAGQGAKGGEWQERTKVVCNLEALDGFDKYFNPWAKQGTFESTGNGTWDGRGKILPTTSLMVFLFLLNPPSCFYSSPFLSRSWKEQTVRKRYHARWGAGSHDPFKLSGCDLRTPSIPYVTQQTASQSGRAEPQGCLPLLPCTSKPHPQHT